MEKQLFNLKFSSKQMVRQSKKCEKEEIKEKKKLKKAIEKGNHEGAKIYAQNAIRQKNQALNYLRMSSRVDAVASRVDSAIKMKQVTRSMGHIVKGMEKSLESMNLEQISAVMDKFESQFEDLDVQSEYVENAMSNTTSMTTPDSEVNGLIQQVADEHGLELGVGMSSLQAGTSQVGVGAEEESLEARLAKLSVP